jgi:hypothetical protein
MPCSYPNLPEPRAPVRNRLNQRSSQLTESIDSPAFWFNFSRADDNFLTARRNSAKTALQEFVNFIGVKFCQ